MFTARSRLQVAVVEDDEVMADTITQWLESMGAAVTACVTGGQLFGLDVTEFDLILLDWMLPDELGDQILARLRGEFKFAGGVIFVTSRDSEDDITFALGLGADDYVVKPPAKSILLSRVGAVMRRYGADVKSKPVANLEPYAIDVIDHTISLHGKKIELTRKEFDLATFFFARIGQLVSRDELLSKVWGRVGIETRTVDNHISRLRHSLSLRADNGFKLSTIYSLGYRLERILGL
jgi:DNA-binding response OmpR family regulator